MPEVQMEPFVLCRKAPSLPSKLLLQNPHLCGVFGSGMRKLSNVWKDLAQNRES